MSPTLTRPDTRVPVTTLPNPFMVKTRSTGIRKNPLSTRSPIRRAVSSMAAASSATPSPVTAETGMIGAPSRKVVFRNWRMSSCTRASQSASTRSILVSAMTPWRIPSRVQMSRCSLVWGMTPSSAAITRSTRSIPVAPATMFLTNFSCPGTSTTPRVPPLFRGKDAKPSSIVMPRSFSSLSRSVSTPVRALTREVFP
ncbi:MAG: hypothetical protein A4E67_01261 [Syntrophaceae bacterium PtaB.Bin038]|nr:MAG: hypothetical protein A4E67_01261 [Syntrophaceae bacterium PtaB.Bin038]